MRLLREIQNDFPAPREVRDHFRQTGVSGGPEVPLTTILNAGPQMTLNFLVTRRDPRQIATESLRCSKPR